MRLRTLSTLLSGMIDILDNAQTVVSAPSRARTLHDTLQSTIEKYEAEKAAHVNAERYLDAAMEQKHQASHERDVIKAQYEAEKAAHGDTQRHLTAAIAERDEAQKAMANAIAWRDDARRLHGEAQAAFKSAVAERDDAKRQLAEVDADRESWRLLAGERMNERDAPRARVAELQAGEPVAWEVVQQPAVLGGMTRSKSLADTWASNGSDVRPLYAAPQPAAPAYGVEGERFVCLLEEQCLVIACGRETGTREEAEARTRLDGDAKVMRLVDADAPVVDVDKIRGALKTLRGIRIWTAGDLQVGADAFATIAAAIGEGA